MIVVSDAGPLIYLGAVQQLELLHVLFDAVLVPEAVWREVVELGAGRPGSAETAAASWIEVRAADDQATRALTDRLHRMDKQQSQADLLRIAFRQFAGEETFRQWTFLAVSSSGRFLVPHRRPTWTAFRSRHPEAPTGDAAVRRLFLWCHVHETELQLNQMRRPSLGHETMAKITHPRRTSEWYEASESVPYRRARGGTSQTRRRGAIDHSDGDRQGRRELNTVPTAGHTEDTRVCPWARLEPLGVRCVRWRTRRLPTFPLRPCPPRQDFFAQIAAG